MKKPEICGCDEALQLRKELKEMRARYLRMADIIALDTVLDMFPKEHQDQAFQVYEDIAKAREEAKDDI